MKIKIALIITLSSLSTWVFAQIGNGGAVHPSGLVVVKPPSSVPAQTPPGLNQPNNVNPNNPNSRLNPVNPNNPNNPANPKNPFNANIPNNPEYRNNTNSGFGDGHGRTNGFGSNKWMTNGIGVSLGTMRRPNNLGIRGFTNVGSGYISTNAGNSYSTNPPASYRNPYAVDPRAIGGTGAVTNR